MAKTVCGAFNEFLTETVNLDPNVTRTAIASRDWLISQLELMHEKDNAVPFPYSERHIAFGSFARRTKIRELDDVDLLWCMKSEGSLYEEVGGTVQIYCPDASRLARFRHAGTSLLNSRLIINQYIRSLADVPQYAKAETRRDGEAAVLALKSYTWSFDIVPGFHTVPEADGRTYYIIPDGAGHWKKTDPRRDRDRVQRVNAANNGNVLNPLRVMKYWNRRRTMPTAPSYMFENLVLDHYESRTNASGYVDFEVIQLLDFVQTAIFQPVWDPKGIQGDLNTLTLAEQLKISVKAAEHALIAKEAWAAESNGDHQTAIEKWRLVLGPAFPAYS